MSDEDDFAAVVLAAGSSSRLGHPKQLVLLHGETLLDRATRIAREGGASEVIVVIGAFADAVQSACTLRDCRVVHNADWQMGMGASLRSGIAVVNNQRGALVTTCDMPFLSAEHYRRLARPGRLTASRYADANGIPAFFPRSYFTELLGLQRGITAKHLLATAEFVDLSDGAMDVDTEQDVKAALARAQDANQGSASDAG